MKILPLFLCCLFLGIFVNANCKVDEQSNSVKNDSLQQAKLDSTNTAKLITYLRANFDDLHDVIMKFHDHNPYLAGKVDIFMRWQNGRLQDSKIMDNSTENAEFANALVEAISKWEIPDLAGSLEITLPIRTQIVGSNDPSFKDCAIFTGKITDAESNPIQKAEIKLIPVAGDQETIPIRRTNREGIFIATLIPAGKYTVICSHPDYRELQIKNVQFDSGKHLRKAFVLKQK